MSRPPSDGDRIHGPAVEPEDRIEELVRRGAQRLDLTGFRTFILRGNVVDLAVGIVIGAAFTAVVQALVTDFITPLIAIPLKHAGNLSDHVWTLGSKQDHVTFRWGDFLNRLITLVLIGLVVYYVVVRPVNRLMARFKPEPDPATATKTCPECKSAIPCDATRCAFCTVEQPPPESAAADASSRPSH